MVNGFQIKVTKIPVAGRGCERDNIVDRFVLNGVLQLLEKFDKVSTVILLATTVTCTVLGLVIRHT